MLDITANSARYQGGEGQSVFPIPFPFLETAHIRAYVAGANGVKRALAAGVDYSVNRVSDANGELILLGDPLPPGSTLAICRLVPLTQDILFHNQGPNSPRAMEEAADKLTMIAQQLQSGIDNCLAVPDGVSAEDAAATIADSAERIGRVQGDIAALAVKVDASAARDHRHAIAGVTGLADELAAKADAMAVSASLAGKADTAQLHTKAALVHTHGMADIGGLSAALAAKLDADDPRLDGVSTGPVGGGGDGAGTLDHSQLLNRSALNQHPQSAIENLGRDLDALRAALAALAGAEPNAVTSVSGRTGAVTLSPADVGLGNVDNTSDMNKPVSTAVQAALAAAGAELASLTGRMNALGAMAAAPDAPANGKPHMRQNGGWIEAPSSEGSSGGSSGGSGGGAIIGEIRLLPFRATALPAGWYFCNGDKFSLATAQGSALNSLPAQMKSDWGITVSGSEIRLPLLFDASGNGYFPRPVNGSDRAPGHVQSDAIRNITGAMQPSATFGMVWVNSPLGRCYLEGAFKTTAAATKNQSFNAQTHGTGTTSDLFFDASGSVPVAAENRPLNVGMTPAIYLGV